MARLTPATHPDQPASASFAADLDILAFTGLALVDDPGLPRPRFRDDSWDFSSVADIPAYAREPNRLRVDWTTIADPRRRLCAKEVGLALLQPQVGLDRRLGAARRRRLPPHVLVTQLHRWRLWFDWLQRHHVARLADVTQAHCDAWLAERRGQVGLTALRAEVINLRLFADYRQILTVDAYREGFRPWAATDASAVTGRPPRGENTTAVIPDEVFAPLLAAALFLVQVAGPDVIAARAEWRQLQQSSRESGAVDDRLIEHLAALRRSGSRLPQLHHIHIDHQRARGILDQTDPLHQVNLTLMERQIGAPEGAISKSAQRRALVAAALEDLGCSGGGLTTPISTVADPADPHGRCTPWHAPFSPFDLKDLSQVILMGCYVVVAALSGLRRSELAEMRRGCVRAEQLANGKLRYRIHAKLIKGKPFGGQDERWTVIPEVAEAFSLAEQLSADDQPFARLSSSGRYHTLTGWVNGPGAHAHLAPIPDWSFCDRQFRRTLARLLGFRPHGVIAGKIHLKHISVATSEGYYGRVGSSAAAFLAEVDQHTAQARIATTKRLFADWAAGRPMTGPGRAELTKLFGHVQDEIAPFQGNVIDSDRRLEELLRRRANTLHVGPLNNCWFIDPARAHCLKQSGAVDATAPLIGMCEPTRCANATIHPEHVPVWIDTHRHLNKLMASPRVSDHEKERLTLEQHRIDSVIAAASAGGHSR